MSSMCLDDSSLLYAFWNCGRELEVDIMAVPRAALMRPRDLTLLRSRRVKGAQNDSYVIPA